MWRSASAAEWQSVRAGRWLGPPVALRQMCGPQLQRRLEIPGAAGPAGRRQRLCLPEARAVAERTGWENCRHFPAGLGTQQEAPRQAIPDRSWPGSRRAPRRPVARPCGNGSGEDLPCLRLPHASHPDSAETNGSYACLGAPNTGCRRWVRRNCTVHASPCLSILGTSANRSGSIRTLGILLVQRLHRRRIEQLPNARLRPEPRRPEGWARGSTSSAGARRRRRAASAASRAAHRARRPAGP